MDKKNVFQKETGEIETMRFVCFCPPGNKAYFKAFTNLIIILISSLFGTLCLGFTEE
jgi:hypothetical protein